MRPHVHQPSPHTDHNGVSICRCGSLETATIHRVEAEAVDEQQAEYRRRSGDLDEGR